MRYIIRYFLKPASDSNWFLRRYSGVKPSSTSSSAGAASYPSAAAAPPASFFSDAAWTPGKDIPAGGGPYEMGNVLTAGMPTGGGIFRPSGGGGGTYDFFALSPASVDLPPIVLATVFALIAYFAAVGSIAF